MQIIWMRNWQIEFVYRRSALETIIDTKFSTRHYRYFKYQAQHKNILTICPPPFLFIFIRCISYTYAALRARWRAYEPRRKASQSITLSWPDTCHAVTSFPSIWALPTSLVVPSPASPAIHDDKEIPHFHTHKKRKTRRGSSCSTFTA